MTARKGRENGAVSLNTGRMVSIVKYNYWTLVTITGANRMELRLISSLQMARVKALVNGPPPIYSANLFQSEWC